MSDQYHVIYDGSCNLCVTFTQILEKFDGGKQFNYIPMQDQQRLSQFKITESDCEGGVILIDAGHTDRRWQGSAAVEEITNLLPGGQAFIAAYRAIPGMKNLGDRAYVQVRDNRYQWFGGRDSVYYSDCGCD